MLQMVQQTANFKAQSALGDRKAGGTPGLRKKQDIVEWWKKNTFCSSVFDSLTSEV